MCGNLTKDSASNPATQNRAEKTHAATTKAADANEIAGAGAETAHS